MEEKILIISEKLKEHDQILKEHDRTIENLKLDAKEFEMQIKNLIEKLDSLVTIMKWFIGLLVGSFVSFFFYVVQRGLLK